MKTLKYILISCIILILICFYMVTTIQTNTFNTIINKQNKYIEQYSKNLQYLKNTLQYYMQKTIMLENTTYYLKTPNLNLLKRNTVVVINSKNSLGGGVCIKEDDIYYYVLTAYHIVKKRYNNVVSILTIDDIIYSGEIIKENKNIDLALLRINKRKGLHFNTLKLAPKSPYVGETVFAIGHPLYTFFNVSKGIVTSYIGIYIIIDALITNGSSGGGVFNNRGELVGIASSVVVNRLKEGYVPESNIGNIISIETIKEFLK